MTPLLVNVPLTPVLSLVVLCVSVTPVPTVRLANCVGTVTVRVRVTLLPMKVTVPPLALKVQPLRERSPLRVREPIGALTVPLSWLKPVKVTSPVKVIVTFWLSVTASV